MTPNKINNWISKKREEKVNNIINNTIRQNDTTLKLLRIKENNVRKLIKI